MSSGGIAGFKGSLERVFPKAQTQRCVVHLVRNIYGICPRKEAEAIIADYKKIYTSTSFEDAKIRLDEFKEKWKKPIPNWKTIQPQLIELFGERYIKHLEI